MTTTEFVPQPITRLDLKKFYKIRELYDELAGDLTLLHSQFTAMFGKGEIEELFAFINCNNPERYLLQRYAATKADDHPGLDVAAMIGAGIVVLPSDYRESLKDFDKLNLTLRAIRDYSFYYPLASLYNVSEDGEHYFSVNDKFRETLESFLIPKTKTHQQNQIVEALKQIQDGMNQLNQLGIMNFKSHGVSFLGMLSDFYQLDKSNIEEPVNISPFIFRKTKLRRFLVNHRNGIDKYRDEVTLWTI